MKQCQPGEDERAADPCFHAGQLADHHIAEHKRKQRRQKHELGHVTGGRSKGKGYQGVIKRFGQHRLRESHGTGPVARHAGSNGSTSTPSRVFKGKRLPGHMGAVRVTVQNLSVVKVDAENNLIAIKGAIPGPKGSVVCVSDSVKA